MAGTDCERCVYYDYDEETDTEGCMMMLDEDEYVRLMTGHYAKCPYFRLYDEYGTARKQ